MLLPLFLEKRLEPAPWLPYLLPVFSIILALLLRAGVLLLTGTNPWEAYREMVIGAFGSFYAFSETIVKAIPLLLTGLGVALAFRMLFWNIGAEGQLYLGAIGATWVALHSADLPAPLLPWLMFLAGCGAGALWGLIPALLRVYTGVNEIITTLMLNYIAILWVDFLVYGPWKDPQGHGFPLTASFVPAARFPHLPGSRVHLGLALGLLAAVFLSFLLWRTRWRYELRMIGLNPTAARYAGINIPKITLLVMAISGGLAGLAGLSEVAGVQGQLKHGFSPGYGYTAIIVAWLARLNPWGVVVVSILLGGLLVGSNMLLSLIHAFLTITLRANQVLSGLALTIFGTGVSGLVGKSFVGIPAEGFSVTLLPILSDLPGLGIIFFQHDPLVYLAYILVPFLWFLLYRTRPGLHIRAIGEDPQSADAMGVRVVPLRYLCVLAGGFLAGVGGAYLSLAYTHLWIENMTAGRGWIALAIVIFGIWNPLRTALGAYLFGGIQALQLRLQALGIEFPTYLLMMAPYIFTIVVLLAVTRARTRRRIGTPAALGTPYSRE